MVFVRIIQAEEVNTEGVGDLNLRALCSGLKWHGLGIWQANTRIIFRVLTFAL
jgi:hypothetical protein